MFGLVTSPERYASNGSKAKPPPPLRTFVPRYTPVQAGPPSARSGYAKLKCAVVARCRGRRSVHSGDVTRTSEERGRDPWAGSRRSRGHDALRARAAPSPPARPPVHTRRILEE